MAVELVDGSVFIHVPKTGGSWVTEVLQAAGLVKRSLRHIHATPQLLRLHHHIGCTRDVWKNLISPRLKRKFFRSPVHSTVNYDNYLDGRFCFAFVRHPLKWYESMWRYGMGSQWKDFTNEELRVNPFYWHPWEALESCRNDNFNAFISAITQKCPGYVSQMYGLYVNDAEVQFIGKQEQLVADLIRVLKERNLSFDENFIRNYRKVNEASHPGSLTWEPDLKAEVERLEYPALKRFGYLS